MSDSKRVQIIRPHQNIHEFIYERNPNLSQEDFLTQKDYHTIGLKRLKQIQTLSLKDNWPIVAGNAIATFSSGFVGGAITHRMARNLSLHVTLSTLPTSGACFLIVTMAHLSTYYYSVLRPMFSNDPMLCPTCLEIRSFALGTFLPITMGTSIAVLANLSSILINKTLRLPRFNIESYPEWKLFFRKHAFKGMSRRYFVAYPLMNGFLASMVFLGQNYYWRNHLQQRLQLLDEQAVPYKEPKKRNKVLGPIQDFFTKLFTSKSR